MNLTMEAIRNYSVPEGSIAIWWLGQAGFLIKSPDGVLVALDPYLSDSCGLATRDMGMNFFRCYPPLMSPAQLKGIDLYAVTHSHQDHLDPETIQGYREAGGDGPYLAPPEAADKLRRLGVPDSQIVTTWPNKSHTVGDLRLRAALAIPFGGDDLTHVGYMVSAVDGPMLYFTGDTAYHETIGISVAEHKPDAMFAVINGTFRNLSPSEAALLASRIQPRVVIPYHYDLFPDGQMPPQTLRMNLMLHEMAERFLTLTPGEVWVCARL